MRLFLAMFVAYLVGSIPTGYILARFKNIDIRTVGSGNVGATNVLRVVGKVAALFTLIIDILKGFVVVAFLAEALYTFRMNTGFMEFQAILGLVVVMGHNWPIFLSFKGGKGVATSAGVLLALCPKLLLIGLCAWLAVFGFSRIVSLSSIISAITIPVASYVFNYNVTIRLLTTVLAILMIFRHRSNIKRLVKKEEKKIIVRI